MDYNTLKYTNLKKNNKISLLVDTNEDNKNKAVVAQGTAKFIHRGKNFENLCKLFHNRFDWVRQDPWKQGDAPFVMVIPNRKVSWR